MTELEALAELRRLHAEYKRRCGTRFAHCLFSSLSVPGWFYDPLKDQVEPYPVPAAAETA